MKILKGIGHVLLGFGIVTLTTVIIIPGTHIVESFIGGMLIGVGGMFCGTE
ncbi:hypothetical protein KAS79_03675 [Candidatus Parcubacteria bacterium]|nr:hypothetical protein [Candidatus Parcubacteria bacterium]